MLDFFVILLVCPLLIKLLQVAPKKAQLESTHPEAEAEAGVKQSAQLVETQS